MPGYELIGKEERDAVNEVFDRGGILYRYGFDEARRRIFRVAEFEAEFARAFGGRYAQAVTSGTAALKLALFALGVRPGDEVITQRHTFVATVEAVMDLGATPVITEVDRTLNMDPRDLEKKITDRTRVMIPVHMLGAPARMDEIISSPGGIISPSSRTPRRRPAGNTMAGDSAPSAPQGRSRSTSGR